MGGRGGGGGEGGIVNIYREEVYDPIGNYEYMIVLFWNFGSSIYAARRFTKRRYMTP